uniref:EF-hand domain-containing protein n=1 Tax=Grammatophora oceanica TaxID=210454 RepID=A0A7S1Y6T5_9STRA
MELLFGMLDQDKSGTIDARELADALRRRNADLGFSESIERSVSFVAAFDEDGDSKLSFGEFKEFLETVLEAIGVTFHELAEFLILQNLFSEDPDPVEELVGKLAETEINEAVKEESEMFRALEDPRMVNLFALFDKDGSGEVDFPEVALGLYQLTENMEDAAKTAITVLLMMDEEDTRTLDYPEFTNLILHIVHASGRKFEEMADDMTLKMLQDKELSEEDRENLIAGNVAYEAIKLVEEEAEAMDILQYGRMQKLFESWDKNGDGALDFSEILSGMRKWQGAMAMEESVERAALAMIGFDEDKDQKLDPVEFAKALLAFSKAAEIDVHEVIDFMVVTSVMEENSPEEEAYIKAISKQATADIKEIEDMLEQHGIE